MSFLVTNKSHRQNVFTDAGLNNSINRFDLRDMRYVWDLMHIDPDHKNRELSKYSEIGFSIVLKCFESERFPKQNVIYRKYSMRLYIY